MGCMNPKHRNHHGNLGPLSLYVARLFGEMGNSEGSGKWRVNGVVRNMPEFQKAFGCKPKRVRGLGVQPLRKQRAR
jgi:hypothetical protein